MKRFALTALIASSITVTAGLASAKVDVEDIRVTIDLNAVENIKAASVWNDLAGDLETAIAAKLIDQISDTGAEVVIDIDEVSLANNFELAANIEEAKLVGDVLLKIPGIANNERYQLTVSANEAKAFYPDGTDAGTVTLESDVFYTAMIERFAENVTAKLK